jgi:flagellar basal body P-ring protein FlgI
MRETAHIMVNARSRAWLSAKPVRAVAQPPRGALGVQPRDLISILQAIKAAGALQAEIMVI